MQQPRSHRGAGAGFIGVGIAFIAIGANGQKAFLGVGLAFLAMGLASLARARRSG